MRYKNNDFSFEIGKSFEARKWKSIHRHWHEGEIYQITIYQPSLSSSQILSTFRKIEFLDWRISPLSSRKYTSREIRISTLGVDRLLLSAKDWPAMGHRLVVSWPQEKSLGSARLTRRMILDGMSKIAGVGVGALG